jgi:DNA-binding ferritin-like protein
MKTHTLENYLHLIQQLLNSKGNEWRVLQQSEELINPELLQVMEKVAQELAAEGNLESAQYLRYWEAQLARLLREATTISEREIHGKSRAYLDLIQALLHCPQGRESELLAVNEELIDAGLIEMMRQMATQTAEQGDRETANFLNNLATEIEQNWLRATQTSSEGDKNGKQEILTVEEPIVPEDPWVQEDTEAEIRQKKEQPSELSLDRSLNDSPVTAPSEDNKTLSSQRETLSEHPIETHLAAIAESLNKLEQILASRLQPADPLWYMDVLERAHASHWIVSTEEIEKLIGIKPKCEPGKNSYQRGCWLFVKAGKMGSQTGWHVIKRNEDFSKN